MLADFWRARYVETFAHLYRPQDLNAFLQAHYAPVIQMAELVDYRFAHHLAFDNAGLVGACKIGAVTLPVDLGGVRAMELHRLYLVERAKGAGIADRLMEWFRARARDDKSKQLYIGVYSENARAIRFYQRHGFEKVGEYEFIVGEARDREFILRAQA
jgi:ribosomal protein S18 acetylase RimI-like enzyme